MRSPPVLVVGVDGTAGSRHALEAAADLALATGARLCVVHVEAMPAAVALGTAGAVAALTEANEVAADAAHLDCELVLAAQPIDWSFETRQGDVAPELQRSAEEHDAAGIVVGRHGHRLVHRMVLGSVTDRLVHHAPVPVLVVPSRDRAAPGSAGDRRSGS